MAQEHHPSRDFHALRASIADLTIKVMDVCNPCTTTRPTLITTKGGWLQTAERHKKPWPAAQIQVTPGFLIHNAINSAAEEGI